MAAITAHILAGHAHPNDGGLATLHQLTLSEGDRPAWLLQTGRPSKSDPRRRERIIWIPTVENMLDDALLMIAVHVIESEPVRTLFGQFSDKLDAERIEMYDDLTHEQRQRLYALCREITNYPKLILCIFEGSSLCSLVGVMEKYQMECEVLVPVYTRTYSRWAKETIIKGSLHRPQ
jgi:hypothetical protein